MDAFAAIAKSGPLPWIVEGLDRRWATDGKRMIVEPLGRMLLEDIYTAVRPRSGDDKPSPIEARDMARCIPGDAPERTIEIVDPAALAGACSKMLAIQEEEAKPRIEEWKADLEAAREKVRRTSGAAKEIAKRDRRRIANHRPPKARTFGRFGEHDTVTELQSVSRAILVPVGAPFGARRRGQQETGIDLRYLRDALRALRGKGKVTLQITDELDPIMLRAGDITIVIMPVRL